MDMDLKRAASIAKMFIDEAANARAAAILNAFLAQIEAARPFAPRARVTADDWRRLGEILVLSDVEGYVRPEQIIPPPELPQGDADPFHSEVERRNGRPVMSTRPGEPEPARHTFPGPEEA